MSKLHSLTIEFIRWSFCELIEINLREVMIMEADCCGLKRGSEKRVWRFLRGVRCWSSDQPQWKNLEYLTEIPTRMYLKNRSTLILE